jgi:uncharacterized protein YbaR (Trm112 family)
LFEYLLGWRQFNIKPTDTVLEVGSGGHPLIRSDILCDKFPFSSYERFMNLPVVMDRPFVVADAEHLPFRGKTIDFLYCTDLAEHLSQPHLFFDECMRVANKGVIITPSIVAERMFGWGYHAVMYEVRDKKLVIHRKTRDNWGLFGGTFHDLWLTDKTFQKFFGHNANLFRMRYEWENKIDYEYAPLQGAVDDAWKRRSGAEHVVENTPGQFENIKRRARSLASKILRQGILRRPEASLEKLVCCPVCHGELDMGSFTDKLVCTSCSRNYKRINNIPILVLDEWMV